MSKTEVAENTAAFKKRATERGFDVGSGWLSWHDDTMFVYATASFITRSKPATGTSFIWYIWAKPLQADEQLWRHLFPESDLGGERKKLTLRANGAFRTTGLPVSEGFFYSDPATIETQIDGFLDEFTDAVTAWSAGSDRVEKYLAAIEADLAVAPNQKLSRLGLMRTTALLVLNRDREALEAATSDLADGRDGSLYDGDKSVNQLIVEHLSTHLEGRA